MANDITKMTESIDGSPASQTPWNIIKNPVNGRTRISQACDRCRARKIKCSGKSENNPRCTNCEKDGFQCVVSDKLTRNSFPKGYTKNLEKKLLDVELQRNRLLLEVNQLKKELGKTGNDIASGFNAADNDTVKGMSVTMTSVSTSCNNLPELTEMKVENSTSAPAVVQTDKNGLLLLNQNVLSPFNTFMKGLLSKNFNGYEIPSGNLTQPCSETDSSKYSSSSISRGGKLPPQVVSTLIKYHMNINRYLNLVFYKLILPLFNFNPSSAPNGSNKNLDHLIWLFFNDYNKLIPILDFELFYNDYLTFVNTYTIQNSTYQENGEQKKKYYEFNLKEQDIMMKLILILKFTLCQPKTNGSLESSLFPDRAALNQLNESIKLINTKHLILMFRNTNFVMEPNLDKIEICLLTFYYLVKFENYNLPGYTDEEHTNITFLRDVINVSGQLLTILNVCKSSNILSMEHQNQEQIINMQRLKLYWDYKILIKLTEIYFNIPLDITSQIAENELPPSIETIKLVNNDIQITLALIKLLDIIPINIMSLVMENNEQKLASVDMNLQQWRSYVNNVATVDNDVVFKKLQSYYAYFKVLINICKSIDGSFYAEYTNIVYNLTFSDSKNPNITNDVSIETAESLCLHSFNFHLISLISIIKLKNIKNKELKGKIIKLVQLYQIIITLKDMDPVFQKLISYINENTSFACKPDAELIQDETLQLFAFTDSNDLISGPFRKKSDISSARNSISFDLNAFSLPGDNCYSVDESIGSKRRKSNSSATSFVSSNLSYGSRESSICSPSRRVSVSSNDGIPSLFASATSMYPSDATSRRNKFRSPSNDSRIRLSRHGSLSEKRGRSGSQGHFVNLTDEEIGPTDEGDSNRSSVSNGKKTSATLPTILSEGNLIKSMNAMNPISTIANISTAENIESIHPLAIEIKEEDNDYDIDKLMHDVVKPNNVLDDGLDLMDLDNIDLGNIDMIKLNKSSNDYNSVFSPSPVSSFKSSSLEKTDSSHDDKKKSALSIDDNELTRLRERVLNLKSTS